MLSGSRTLAICLLAAWVLPVGPLMAQDGAATAASKGATSKPKAKDADDGKPGDPQKKDPNIALKAYELGTKAYDAGKYEPAIQAFSTALANGGLPADKMAKSYYLRGMCNKKLKKSAQALSDFTIAVWVNGGLNDSDRAAALEQRNTVYREAGLGDQAPPIASAGPVTPPAPATSTTAAAATPPAAGAPVPPSPVAAPAEPLPAASPPPVAPAPAPPPATVTQPATTPAVQAAAPQPAAGTGERPVWQADPNSQPPPPMAEQATPAQSWSTVPAPAAPPPTQQTAATTPTPEPALTAAPNAPAAPAEPTSTMSDTLSPVAKAGESIGNFFSNMFGQSSPPPPQQQAQAQPAPSVTTGSTTDGAWASDVTHPAGPSAQVSASEPQRAPGFETTTAPAPQTTRHATATQASPQPVAAPAAVAAVKTSPGGKYRLQLASVRSREEADRLVQTLLTTHADRLGGAEPMVDETVIGNMGTFYRVRLGPFANANEPGKLCAHLKPEGYDCQVVTK